MKSEHTLSNEGTHPLSYHNYMYNGSLTKQDLIKIWGNPYYPYIPFILERINLLFFVSFIF